MSSSRPSWFRYGFAFALTAALLALLPLALRTYQLCFAPGAPFSVRETIGVGVPIPRGLAWTPLTRDIIMALGALAPPAQLGFFILLGGTLVYGLLRILNPTFRLTSGVDWDRQVLTHTYMHTPPLIKAFLIAVTAALPAFAAWHALVYLFGENGFSLWLRMALLGAVGWLLFSHSGVAGDYESGNYELPREKRERYSLLLRGALAGTAGALAIHFPPAVTQEEMFRFYRMLGGVGEGHWRVIAGLFLGFAAMLGITGAGLAIALGAPNLDARDRFRAGVLPALLLALLLLFGRVWLPSLLQSRHDYPPGSLMEATRRLAATAGVRLAPSGTETLAILRPGEAVWLNVPLQSIVGIDGSREAAHRVEAFLERRGFATALADPAFKTLHDSASLAWDPVESLRVDYLNLTRCPDPAYLSLLIDKLRICASTPETRRYADLFADETHFTFPDQDSLLLMGDIYARLGEREKAEKWYRRADIPASRLNELLTERVMMREGRVTGRLLINNRPARGVHVGLVPDSMVREAFRSALRPGLIRPFWLRWLTAVTTTDAAGRFALTNIVAGHYRLVVHSPAFRLRAGPLRLPARNAPGEMFVAYGKPHFELGNIALTVPTSQEIVRRPDAFHGPKSH